MRSADGLSIYQAPFMIVSSNINIRNKYNMLEAGPARVLHFARFGKEHSTPPPSNRNFAHHVLTLDLSPSPSSSPYKPTPDSDFKTFYNTTSRSWRISHLRGQHHRSKESASADRQSVVGTPFVPSDAAERETSKAMMPLMDG
jgi:hypothetical protein